MGYDLNRLDEPVFIAVSKPLITEFGIRNKLESYITLFLPNVGPIEGNELVVRPASSKAFASECCPKDSAASKLCR